MLDDTSRYSSDYLARARSALNSYSEGSEASAANALIAIAQQQRTNAAELGRLADHQERLADGQARTAAALERIATALERHQADEEPKPGTKKVSVLDVLVLITVIWSGALCLVLILTGQ